MTFKKLTLVSLRIILVFVSGIVMSLIGDCLHSILGDWHCRGCNYAEMGNYEIHVPQWHWGWRHWLFMLMGFCLFIVQTVDIINFIDSTEKTD